MVSCLTWFIYLITKKIILALVDINLLPEIYKTILLLSLIIGEKQDVREVA